MDCFDEKSSIEEIEERFDHDVERFSNLQTGQTATIDAVLAMELITKAALASSAPIQRVLDIGCGAGNNTLKLLEFAGYGFTADLLDLSANMLSRAKLRVEARNCGVTRTIKGDFRSADLAEGAYDVILAAAVLHHLRDDEDWETVFAKIYRSLRRGGSVWITDLVSHESEAVQQLMWQRYGAYLDQVGADLHGNGPQYRQIVFDYIDKEDSPRPVTYQLALLKMVGFSSVELLHKNSCFAACGAVK